MRKLIIPILVAVATLALAAVPAHAAPISVRSGDRYWVTAEGKTEWCTIAAVGYWRDREVALTAGHCGHVGFVAKNDAGQRIGEFVESVSFDSNIAPDHAFIALDPGVVEIHTLTSIAAPQLWQFACKQGWGMLNEGTRCGLVYGTSSLDGWSTIAMFFGDSGGPVIQNGKLIGITSRLADTRYPGAFMMFARADRVAGFSL